MKTTIVKEQFGRCRIDGQLDDGRSFQLRLSGLDGSESVKVMEFLARVLNSPKVTVGQDEPAACGFGRCVPYDPSRR